MQYNIIGRTTIFSLALYIFLTGATLAENIKNPDFSGFWEITEFDDTTRPNDTGKYTEEAQQRIKSYHDNFDLATESGMNFCDSPGMPWIMLGKARTYAREIYQKEDRIFYLYEFMDMYRQIFMDKPEVPVNFVNSKQGYSIGHWEKDELVIITEGLTDLEYAPVQRTSQAKIYERWRMLKHPKYGDVIEITMEVIDPGVYKQPAYGKTLLKRASKDTVLSAYACSTTLWEEFAEQRIEENKIRIKE